MFIAAMTTSTAIVLARKKNETDERNSWRCILNTPPPPLFLDPKLFGIFNSYPGRSHIFQWAPQGPNVYDTFKQPEYVKSHDSMETTSLTEASSISLHSSNSRATRESIKLPQEDLKYNIYISRITTEGLIPPGSPIREWLYFRFTPAGDTTFTDSDNMIYYISAGVFFDGKRFSFNKYIKLLSQQLTRHKCRDRKKLFHNAGLLSGPYKSGIGMRLGVICGFLYWYGRPVECSVDIGSADYAAEDSSIQRSSSTECGTPRSKLTSVKSVDRTDLAVVNSDLDLASISNKSKYKQPTPQTTLLRGAWTRLRELTGGGISRLPMKDGEAPDVMPLLRASRVNSQLFTVLHTFSGVVYLTYLGFSKREVLYPIIWSLKMPKERSVDVSIHECSLVLGLGKARYMMVPVSPDDLIWSSPHHSTIPDSTYKDNVSPIKEVQLRRNTRVWKSILLCEENIYIDAQKYWVRISLRLPKNTKAASLSHILLLVQSSIFDEDILVPFLKIWTFPIECDFEESTSAVPSDVESTASLSDSFFKPINELLCYASETAAIVSKPKIELPSGFEKFSSDSMILFSPDAISEFVRSCDNLRALGSNSYVYSAGNIRRMQVMAMGTDYTDIEELKLEPSILRYRLFVWRSSPGEEELVLSKYVLASANSFTDAEPMVSKSIYGGLFRKFTSSKIQLKIDKTLSPYLHRSFYSRKNKGSTTSRSRDFVIPLIMIDLTEKQDIHDVSKGSSESNK